MAKPIINFELQDQMETKKEYNKTYYDLHRDELVRKVSEFHRTNPKWKEYIRKKVKCPCGSVISNAYRSGHYNTRKHRLFELGIEL